MSEAAVSFNPRYPAPSAEVQRMIMLSIAAARKVGSREMRCPVCGFKVADVPLTQTEVVYVRCRKCKFEGPLSPAYFRRMKRYASEISSLYGSSNSFYSESNNSSCYWDNRSRLKR